MFSVRSQQWTPFEQLDFCARWGLSVVHFSDPRQIGGLEPEHLRSVKAHADGLGLEIELGMLSFCPSSSIFDAAAGRAEEQILRMLPAARLLGSPIVRCVVGRFPDRVLPGGIEQRIADALSVLRKVRSQVVDAGLKLAVENHAGDLQARELKMLVDEAGTDFVGVCLDAGNALWAMEDPHLSLETLAPCVLTSHTRDTLVWPVESGAAVAWTRMGEGNVRIDEYLRAFAGKCPGRPVSLEIIIRPEPRVLNYRDPNFWEAYPKMPGWEFVRFEELVNAGSPVDTLRTRSGSASEELDDVETSLRWTKNFFGQP